ncbi:MAG: hypothetical protein CVU86_03060 [Firmicutes bacterium HGW-Firmicutes-11]|nr:MAG: hypothetical protein CVU86_03060 [Firmicutes bacterium HGW-Firmicutes-11]
MNEIAYLADRFPQATTISLFQTTRAATNGNEAATLAAKGVLEDGVIAAAARPVLEILADAKQAARLIVRDGLTVLEAYAYRLGETIALVENQGEDIDISLPEDFSHIGYDVSQYIGTSARKTTGIEVLLPEEEAMTLLALIDVYRHWTLRSYLGEEVADTVLLEDIQRQAAATGDSSLTDLFRISFGYEAPEENQISRVLDTLVKKEIVTKEDGYRLRPEYALFAKSFLVPATSLLVESFSIDAEGQLVIGGGLGLTAGVCDHVFFLVDAEEVELKAVAGLEMMQTIEGFLACPEL